MLTAEINCKALLEMQKSKMNCQNWKLIALSKKAQSRNTLPYYSMYSMYSVYYSMYSMCVYVLFAPIDTHIETFLKYFNI